MTDSSVDFLLENMMQLINSEHELILKAFDDKLIDKDRIEWLYGEMQFLRKFLKDSEEKRDEHEEVKDLVAKIRDVTYEVEDIIDSSVLNAALLNPIFIDSLDLAIDEKRSRWVLSEDYKLENVIAKFKLHMAEKVLHGFGGVMEEINSIKMEVMKIYEKKMYGVGVLQAPNSSQVASSRATSPIVEEETIVGFDDEIRTIMELLTEEHEQQLKLIAILGMPGLGKTTLLKKVFNDAFIQYHFYIRAWTYVSQEYEERDLLLKILLSGFHFGDEIYKISDKMLGEDEIYKMSDKMLGELLYKGLKGNKYFIVMDDIWNNRVWYNLKLYFPDDNCGSRIVFTSRHVDVAVALYAKPHHLRFLNEYESWDLLRQKVFQRGSCPQELMEIGKKIAKKCEGLPLAISVVAGLLTKKEKTQDWWRHVGEQVSSYIVSDPEQYMDTLALSYNHLPHHLKPCFLYFGAFPEDYEVRVRNLIWLWIAEGFIQQNEHKSLEEVAENYLMELIDRSLVMISKRSFDNKIKECRVHDLLRDLCLRRAKEEKFLQPIYKYEPLSVSFSSFSSRRVSIHQGLDLCLDRYRISARSFLSFQRWRESWSNFYFLEFVSNICQALKLLRVLDLSATEVGVFPKEINLLVHLRYLALYPSYEIFQISTSNLWNLETLIIYGLKGWLDFSDIWKMVKLRHLHTPKFIMIPSEVPKDGFPFVLKNLQTIGIVNISCRKEQVLKWIPNLRKLKCYFWESLGGYDHFPKLDFLLHLETLNVTCGSKQSRSELLFGPGRFPRLDEFPPNLKSLTFADFCLPWEEMSTLGKLPNLEILKLEYGAFEGPKWDTSEGEFSKLKFLKLSSLDIEQWNSSADHFPNLQTLMLSNCKRLKEVPFDLGDISTLELIQLQWCNDSAVNSARQIQKQQLSMGNDGLIVEDGTYRQGGRNFNLDNTKWISKQFGRYPEVQGFVVTV